MVLWVPWWSLWPRQCHFVCQHVCNPFQFCSRVYATYNSVKGSCSEPVSFTTHSSAPESPFPPKASHRTKSSLTLQWKVGNTWFRQSRAKVLTVNINVGNNWKLRQSFCSKGLELALLWQIPSCAPTWLLKCMCFIMSSSFPAFVKRLPSHVQSFGFTWSCAHLPGGGEAVFSYSPNQLLFIFVRRHPLIMVQKSPATFWSGMR